MAPLLVSSSTWIDGATLLVNAAVLLSAVVLGTLGWHAASAQAKAARTQAEEAARATYLAYQPRLVPIHESATMLSSEPRPGFPADVAGDVSHEAIVRVFRVASERQKWRAVLHLGNIGQGSAKILNLRLSSGNGFVYEGQRGVVVGATESVALVVELKEQTGIATAEAAWRAFADRWGVEELDREWAELAPPVSFAPGMSRLFFLEVEYEDLFPGPGVYRLRAWFDPRGHGMWRIALEEQSPGRESLRGIG